MDNENTKRTLLAVVLSTVVIIGWSYFFAPEPQQQTAPAPEATQTQQAVQQVQTAQPSAAPEPAFTPIQGVDVTIDTPLYTAKINSAGGVLTDFRLKNYKTSIDQAAQTIDLVSPAAIDRGLLGLLWNGQGTWRDAQWAAPSQRDVFIDKNGNATVSFSGKMGDLVVVRELTFSGDTYLIEENVTLQNASSTPISGRLGFTLATDSLTAEDDRYNPTRVAWLTPDGADDEDDREDLGQGMSWREGVQWGAVKSNYFALAVAPEPGNLALHGRYRDNLFRVQMDKENIDLATGTTRTVKNAYYFGPIMDRYLAEAPNGLDKLVSYGFFDIISRPLIKFLHMINDAVGNWGLAIIILTIIIKIIFWPLSHKSYKSMNQMKKLQPLMAKIREQHKDDRQKMNEEIMNLYKTYKVNPAGGCMPMLLQIPVFLGLYQALLGAVELRHASFIEFLPGTDLIWLADLSAKDPYYITPIIMGASMFLQQKMTPSPGDPTQAKIMLFMPVIFTVMFLNFPAGLVVYWLVNNVLSIAQQWMMLRKA